MNAMANPPNPGETVRFDCIEASNLAVTDAARLLPLPPRPVAPPERPNTPTDPSTRRRSRRHHITNTHARDHRIALLLIVPIDLHAKRSPKASSSSATPTRAPWVGTPRSASRETPRILDAGSALKQIRRLHSPNDFVICDAAPSGQLK